jgi:hypothetical protein
VSLFDSGELPDGSAFLVLELLDGLDLANLLSGHGAGRPSQVAALVRQASAALAERPEERPPDLEAWAASIAALLETAAEGSGARGWPIG